MTLEEIKISVEKLVNKDVSGYTLTPTVFNLWVEMVNNEIYQAEWNDILKVSAVENIPLRRLIETSSKLLPFKKTATLSSLALEIDYQYYTSAVALNGGFVRPLEILPDRDFDDLKINVLVDNLEEYPKAKIENGVLSVIPSDITVVSMSYLAKPVTPFYDYCVDQYNNIVYMPVGSRIITSPGTYDLVDSGGSVIKANVTHLTTSSYPYTSLTIELEFGGLYHPEVIKGIVDKVLQSQQNAEAYQINAAEK